MAKPSLNKIRKRMLVMTGIIIVALGLLVVRMAYWQIIRGEEMSTKAKNQQQSDDVVTASRGKIYDRNGKVLAESASVDTLVCNPQDVKENGDADYIADNLSKIIDIDRDKIYDTITQTKYQYRVLKKRLSIEESDAIEKYINDDKKFKGIYFENDSKRYYPFDVASHVLGWVNSDNNGASGVEMIYDDVLSGKAGTISTNRSATGTTLDENQAQYLTESDTGSDVVLTIDETIQHFLEKHLEEAVKEDELKEGAAGIVMNPKTGEVLAMATKPDFDSNSYDDVTRFANMAIDFTYETQDTDSDSGSTPKPTEDPDNLSDETIAAMRNKMWRNKAVSDSYEPGSTFKIITAAAALEEHVVDENSTFYCPGYKIVEDRKIGCSNTSGHGAQTFVEGVQNSCNPVFMELGLKLGEEKFMEYFRSFGLTEKTGISLNGESSGIYYTNGMNNVDIAISSFGQGFQVTPIQFITAISAVINGGERMKPQIVKEIRGSDGVIQSFEPEVVNRVISEETSDKMRSIIESVVSKPGATGKNAYVKGFRIGGKTGTSEKTPRGTNKRIASFVGFAPANDPEIICLVMLDEPQVENKYGGTIAAPLVGELIEDILNYLGTDKQYSEDEEPDNTIEVPDVRGLSLSEAKKAITDAGLKYTVSGEDEEIVSQLPKPGVMMNEDSIIILYTEEKDDEDIEIEVPDVTGLSVEEARYALEVKNLNFEVAGAGHSEAYNAYAVNQSIKAGEKVMPGTVVGVEFRQEASD